MSKEIEWGMIHGEGTIVCTCDQCGKEHEVDFDGGSPRLPGSTSRDQIYGLDLYETGR